ncbi:MAG: hypothetical protein A3F92_09770 [Candidatus Rokubacteria bacterium RIFCSPLOWO2_12_FULL_71_22]|nr:MAG: hypothetical protein A3I17_11975 [Candidatus Rokubacteria bacterium RIFCSPLOWO2_02_FULL_72_37]OGL14610.1 MAG: hypothetical protein A3F92_09770 [Candidatus Rokubacteria bacterium RIFCSPLOWO2_12_FULL_71_22]
MRALIDALAATGDLDRDHLLHAARADLLRRLGSSVEAAKRTLTSAPAERKGDRARAAQRALETDSLTRRIWWTVGPTASALFQLGFAAPTRETPKTLDSVIGLRVRSHTISPPG